MPKKALLFPVWLLLISLGASAQIGGQYAFSFLDIPVSARSSSLGGSSIGYKDNDINIIMDNPSNLDTSLHTHFAANYINFVSNINAGTFYYAHRLKKSALGFGVNFLGYGNFEQRDASGNKIGDFKAGDYGFNVGWGRSFDTVWSVGVNAKVLLSDYFSYTGVGLAFDIGGGYQSKNKLFTAGLVAKNIGMVFTTNAAGDRDKLPFQVQIGLSQRVPRSPFRFHLQYHHLTKWDLGSNDPNYSGGNNVNTKTGETSKKTFTADNFFRHIVIGSDLVFGENFYLTISYNFRRRAELAFNQNKALAGFSFGAGLKIKRLRFTYSYSSFTLAGNSNHIGISTNFSEYFTIR